jgi:hypothetical protein
MFKAAGTDAFGWGATAEGNLASLGRREPSLCVLRLCEGLFTLAVKLSLSPGFSNVDTTTAMLIRWLTENIPLVMPV